MSDVDRTKGVMAYNPYTGKYEPANEQQIAEHAAQANSEPAPGDRKPTDEESERLSGVGPVVTTGAVRLPGNTAGQAAHEIAAAEADADSKAKRNRS